MKDLNLLHVLACPACGSALHRSEVCFQCGTCRNLAAIRGGKVFFSETPSDSPLKSDSQAKDKSRWTLFRLASYSYLAKIFSQISPDALLIDLGAGPNQFAELTDQFTSIIRVDFVPYQDVDVIADLGKRLPFQDHVADAVLLSNVLEHIADPDAFLSEAHRIMRPGARLAGIIPFLLGVHQRPYDFQRFTDIGLERHLQLAGFKNIQITAIGSPSEVFQTFQRHYFQKLFDYVREEQHTLWGRIAVKIGWTISRLLARFLSLLRRSNDPSYCLGYGFFAERDSL